MKSLHRGASTCAPMKVYIKHGLAASMFMPIQFPNIRKHWNAYAVYPIRSEKRLTFSYNILNFSSSLRNVVACSESSWPNAELSSAAAEFV